MAPIKEKVIRLLEDEADKYEEIAAMNWYTYHNHDYLMRADGLRKLIKVLQKGRKNYLGEIVEIISLDGDS